MKGVYSAFIFHFCSLLFSFSKYSSQGYHQSVKHCLDPGADLI